MLIASSFAVSQAFLLMVVEKFRAQALCSVGRNISQNVAAKATKSGYGAFLLLSFMGMNLDDKEFLEILNSIARRNQSKIRTV